MCMYEKKKFINTVNRNNKYERIHYNVKCILHYAMTQGDDKSFEITKCTFIVTDIIIYSNANKNCSNVKLLFSNTFIFIHVNLVDDKISNINLQTTVTNQIIRNAYYVIIYIVIYYSVSDLLRHITKTPCLNTKNKPL